MGGRDGIAADSGDSSSDTLRRRVVDGSRDGSGCVGFKIDEKPLGLPTGGRKLLLAEVDGCGNGDSSREL